MSDAPVDDIKRTSKSKKSRKKKKKRSKERSLEDLPPPLLKQEDAIKEDEDNKAPADDDPANRPCPYRRNYRCKLCEFLTLHPREFLSHLRDSHHQKLTIHQCPKCEYASRHQQKLKRHIGLTHNRGKDTRAPPKNPRRSKLIADAFSAAPTTASTSSAQETPCKTFQLRVKLGTKRCEPSGDADGKDGGRHSRKRVKKSERAQVLNPTDAAAEAAEALLAVAARAANFDQMPPSTSSMSPKEKDAEGELHSCSVCTFQSHSKVTVARHERMVHLRKKFFRCAQCAYVTHIRSRYTKHLRYHNLPYIKCDFCDFTTPYKWNLDRHLRNHEPGAGDFACVMCGFATHSKQSLTVHVANHHLSAQQFAHKMLDKPKPRRRGHQSAPEGDMDHGVGDDEGLLAEGDEDDAVEVEVDENGGLHDDHLAAEMDDDSMLESMSEFPPEDDHCQDDVVFVKDGRICRPPKNALPLPSLPPPTIQTQQQRCVLCNRTFEDRQMLTSHLKMIHRVPAPILLSSFTSIETALLGQNSSSGSLPPSLPQQSQQHTSHVVQTQPSSKGPDGVLQTTRSHRVVRPPKLFVPEGDENNSSVGNNGECHWDDDGKKSLLRCDLCPYEAKWISELVKHRRVHTQEKPFACPHCEFRSRWKGDMTRHVQKYHLANDGLMPDDGEGLSSSSSKGVPPPAEGIETLMAQSMQVGSEDELVVLEDGRTIAMSADGRPETVSRKVSAAMTGRHHLLRHREEEELEQEEEEQHDNDFPLDLSRRVPVTRGVDVDVERLESRKRMVDDGDDDLDNLDRLLALPASKRAHVDGSPEQSHSSPGRTQRIRARYQCPRCGFSARTASRFHVHIVGHLNQKPFMCSECGYRSNWEWDVNKHIRIKLSKGESHSTATLVAVNECGNRNYEKYDKFLVYEVVDKSLPTSSGAASAEEDADVAEGNVEDEGDEEDEDEDDFQDSSVVEPAPLISANKRRRTSWKCKYCNFKHTLKRAIVRHAVVHSENKRYWCGSCGQASNWHHCMLRHCRSRHGADGPIYEHMQSAADSAAAAVPAEADFYSENHLSNENDGTGGRKQHCCNICPYRTRKLFDLKMHYFLHQPRPGAVFKCEYCPFYVSAKRSLMPHMRLHVQDEIPEGNECGNDYEDSVQDEELAVEAEQMEEEEEDEVEEEDDEDAVEKYNDRDMDAAVTEEPDVDGSTESSIPLVWASRGGAFQKMFKCRFCPHVNKKKWTIVEHEKLHQKQEMVGKFACNKCNYKCNNQGVLTAHLKVHRNVVQVHAYVAEEETEATVAAANTTGSPQHVVATSKAINTGKTYHKCPQCPARFSKLRVWEVHQTFHGASLPWKCEQCSYAARHRPHLHKHQLVHSEEYALKFVAGGFAAKRPVVVVQPGTESYPKYDDTVPMRSIVHNPIARAPTDTVKAFVKRHRCHKCPAVFLKPASLVSHLKLHGAKGRYRCPHCEYTVQNVGNLVRHAKLHDAPEQTPETVEEPRTMPQQVPMSSKYKGQGGFFPVEATRKTARLKCPKCPASFEKRSRFQVHVRLHGSDQRYQCASCDYSVHCRANLYKHERVHDQEEVKTAPELEMELEQETEMPYDLSYHEPQVAVPCPPRVPSAPMPIAIPSTSAGTIAAAERHQNQLLRTMVQEAATAHRAESACNHSDGYDIKKVFRCGRCPYSNHRKDAVQSHIKRHVGNSQENCCPHCDYGSALHSFLKDHARLHFRPLAYSKKVDGYFSCDDYEVWGHVPGGTVVLIFRSRDGAGGTEAFMFPQSYPFTVDDVNKSDVMKDKGNCSNRDESSDASIDSDGRDFVQMIRYKQSEDGIENVSTSDHADESSPAEDISSPVRVTEDNSDKNNVDESMAMGGRDAIEESVEQGDKTGTSAEGIVKEPVMATDEKDPVTMMEEEDSMHSESGEESTVDSAEDGCNSDDAVEEDESNESSVDDAGDDPVENDEMLDARNETMLVDVTKESAMDDVENNSAIDDVRKEETVHNVKECTTDDAVNGSTAYDAENESNPEDAKDESTPDEENESMPDDAENESTPDDCEDESNPDDAKDESNPDDAKDESTPDDAEDESMQDDAVKESTPGDAVNESTPDDTVVESTPDDTVVESTPDDTIKESTLDDLRSESTLGDTKVESTVSADILQCNEISNLKPRLDSNEKSPPTRDEEQYEDISQEMDTSECPFPIREEEPQNIDHCADTVEEVLHVTKNEYNDLPQKSSIKAIEAHDREVHIEASVFVQESLNSVTTDGDSELVKDSKTAESPPVNDAENDMSITESAEKQDAEEFVSFENADLNGTGVNENPTKDESLPVDTGNSMQRTEEIQIITEDTSDIVSSVQSSDESSLNAISEKFSEKAGEIVTELDENPTEPMTVDAENEPKDNVMCSDMKVDMPLLNTPEQNTQVPDDQCEEAGYLTVEEAVARLFENEEQSPEIPKISEKSEFNEEETFLENVAVEVEVDENVEVCDEDSYADAIVLLEESGLKIREQKP